MEDLSGDVWQNLESAERQEEIAKFLWSLTKPAVDHDNPDWKNIEVWGKRIYANLDNYIKALSLHLADQPDFESIYMEKFAESMKQFTLKIPTQEDIANGLAIIWSEENGLASDVPYLSTWSKIDTSKCETLRLLANNSFDSAKLFASEYGDTSDFLSEDFIAKLKYDLDKMFNDSSIQWSISVFTKDKGGVSRAILWDGWSIEHIDSWLSEDMDTTVLWDWSEESLEHKNTQNRVKPTPWWHKDWQGKVQYITRELNSNNWKFQIYAKNWDDTIYITAYISEKKDLPNKLLAENNAWFEVKKVFDDLNGEFGFDPESDVDYDTYETIPALWWLLIGTALWVGLYWNVGEDGKPNGVGNKSIVLFGPIVDGKAPSLTISKGSVDINDWAVKWQWYVVVE